ncbi:hypothetical protein RvY_19034 [Ramazzottius varieornatus]|uniref:Dynein intermediate chain 3, ciliary n=1 Tax=Ramazzottius varieornatus TaxID=947166 RepID=A0A1D1W7Z4_RAMVA|nr:hypothetical protein RvY_19034 [Ramazzottius varieornatus]
MGKVAVCYQENGDPNVPYHDEALFGSIWDVNLMYKPLQIFVPPFRLYSIVYNPKDTTCIVGSLWTGQLSKRDDPIVVYEYSQWDTRVGAEPTLTTELEIGHEKICRKVQWLQSKTMTEIVSVGMDGQMIFWDIRKWDEPIERIIMDPNRTKAPTLKEGAPCSTVDFDQGIPSRLCAGSDKGYIFNINRKSKNAHEKITWVWKDVVTPVLSLQRNIAHPRYMLAVTCDDAKIFAEDCRDSWTIDVRPTEGHFTSGCWSSTRPGVFMTTQTNGCLAAYDLNRGVRCTTPAAWIDVDTKCLTSVSPHDEGRLYAVGGINGTWGIAEVSNALFIPTAKEKTDVGELFERESRREKILEGRGREKLAQMRKESAARQEAIAAAIKSGKVPPLAEREDKLDPAYNLPFRPGPITPQEAVVKKDLPKEKASAMAQEAMRQYEAWVKDEEDEMRHRKLPTVFDWQPEDEGVGTLVAKMGEKVPGQADTQTEYDDNEEEEKLRPPLKRQLGIERKPLVKDEGEEKEKVSLTALPMDFAADVRAKMAFAKK